MSRRSRSASGPTAPHLSCGGGARYDTPVGPIRLDIGYRIPGLQYPGGASFELEPALLLGHTDCDCVRYRRGILSAKARALRAHSGARSIGFLATFGGALVAGVALHANTAAFRRLAATIGNEAMGGLFDGKLVVRDVQSLSLGATSKVRIREAEVTDPEGHRVIW